jgi:Gpi18-like mannosyltransferase
MNDNVMAFYLVVAVYLYMLNKPLWSSLVMSISLSLKVGSILMLPAFAGSIQMNYGTRTLLKSLFIIVMV